MMAAMGDSAIAVRLLGDGFGRIHEGVPSVLGGLSADELRWRPDADANPIAWLVWHLTRQQDSQVAHLAGTTSAWSGGWCERFGLPYDKHAHGYGMTSDEVAAFDVTDLGLLTGYHEATHRATLAWLDTVTDADWSRVVDRWDPPVTLAVRAVSILEDSAKHLGQAEYVRGLALRRR
jgi:hypothetical protein